MEAVIFFVFAAIALGGALGVVLFRNPVHSALALVATLLSVAVFFLQQEAQLVAAVQVIVYASAIVVLFLFVIMLLGVDRTLDLDDPRPYQRPLALGFGCLLFAEVIFLTGRTWTTGLRSLEGSLGGEDGGNVDTVARSIFGDYLWPFEITAVLLVIAVVGAVVLSRQTFRSSQIRDDVDAPGDADADATGGGSS